MVQRPPGPAARRDDLDEARKSRSPWLWLLAIPYPALLWVPFYNAAEPRFLGFPFFYTYQMAFVVLTAIVTGIVFLVTD